MRLSGKTDVRNGGQVRRIVGVLASAVLALALSYASATAAGLSFGRPSGDLASQLMLSLFGETSDSSAAFSAQNGDRASRIAAARHGASLAGGRFQRPLLRRPRNVTGVDASAHRAVEPFGRRRLLFGTRR